MKRNFTKTLWSFLLIFSVGVLLIPEEVSAQNCTNPSGVIASDVSNFTATLNWNIDNNVDHYRLRYKELGTTG